MSTNAKYIFNKAKKCWNEFLVFTHLLWNRDAPQPWSNQLNPLFSVLLLVSRPPDLKEMREGRNHTHAHVNIINIRIREKKTPRSFSLFENCLTFATPFSRGTNGTGCCSAVHSTKGKNAYSTYISVRNSETSSRLVTYCHVYTRAHWSHWSTQAAGGPANAAPSLGIHF